MGAQENTALLRRFVEEGQNGGNTEIVDAVYARDYVSHDPDGDTGIDDIKRLIRQVRESFPDARFTIEDIVADGDRVASRVVFRATHRGEFMGAAPTGNPIELTFMNIDRFEGGKIVESWSQFDTLRSARQLGLLPAAAEATS